METNKEHHEDCEFRSRRVVSQALKSPYHACTRLWIVHSLVGSYECLRPGIYTLACGFSSTPSVYSSVYIGTLYLYLKQSSCIMTCSIPKHCVVPVAPTTDGDAVKEKKEIENATLRILSQSRNTLPQRRLPLDNLLGEVLVDELQIVRLQSVVSARKFKWFAGKRHDMNSPSAPPHWGYHHSCCTDHKG